MSMKDEHVKDAAQDVAGDVTQDLPGDVLGAAESAAEDVPQNEAQDLALGALAARALLATPSVKINPNRSPPLSRSAIRSAIHLPRVASSCRIAPRPVSLLPCAAPQLGASSPLRPFW